MISMLRAWGMVSLLVLVAMWHPSLQTWSPAEAVRSPVFDDGSAGGGGGGGAGPLTIAMAVNPRTSVGQGRFSEAPAFRNGRECARRKRSSSESSSGVCDADAVHIAMTLDAVYLRGSMAAVFSILKHSACPESVVFHFLVSSRDAELEGLLRKSFPFLRLRLYHFDEALVKTRISSSVRTALEQPLNYARNYLPELLEPCVRRVIYLDSDLVVVDDIAKLWATGLGPHAVGAPEYCHANFSSYFTPAFWGNSSLASAFWGRRPCYFNTGVMVMDLARWREEDYTRRIEAWMDVQKETRIYELGSLPAFLLVFAGSVQPIEHRWNQHGLGGDNWEGRCRHLHAGPVSLLHWSGKGKPWLRLDERAACPIDSLWAPYDLLETPVAFA